MSTQRGGRAVVAEPDHHDRERQLAVDVRVALVVQPQREPVGAGGVVHRGEGLPLDRDGEAEGCPLRIVAAHREAPRRGCEQPAAHAGLGAVADHADDRGLDRRPQDAPRVVGVRRVDGAQRRPAGQEPGRRAAPAEQVRGQQVTRAAHGGPDLEAVAVSFEHRRPLGPA
jgi:hypothetical protein